MFESRVVEVGGIFAGAAVTVAGNFRFVAVDPRVEELDGSVWPSLADVERVVGSLLRRNHYIASVAPQPKSAAQSWTGV